MATAAGPSALAAALARVGDRWTLLVIEALLEGPQRFSELQASVAGIAPNILTRRLRDLEREGLVVATPYSERPPRFAYDLTVSGRDLAGAVRLLAQWGAAHDETAPAFRHQACGTPAEPRWYCPTCERPVDDETGDVSYA
jgi:DNA-binding HxlR family transcriptional regulator